jgi:hypothetical protein
VSRTPAAYAHGVLIVALMFLGAVALMGFAISVDPAVDGFVGTLGDVAPYFSGGLLATGASRAWRELEIRTRRSRDQRRDDPGPV